MEKNMNKNIAMAYMKNLEKAPYVQGNVFGQDIEPKGEYISKDTYFYKNEMAKFQGWEYGYIEFDNPLFLDHKSTGPDGWKKDLSEMYKGLTGKRLSNAIMKEGYDSIITVDGNEYSEIVNLKGNKITKEEFDNKINFFQDVKNRIIDNLSKNIDEEIYNEKIDYINSKYGNLDNFTEKYIKEATSNAAREHQVEHIEVNPTAAATKEITVADVNEFIASEKELDAYNKELMQKKLSEFQEKHIQGDFNHKHLYKINAHLTNQYQDYEQIDMVVMEKLNETVFKDIKENKFLKGMDHVKVSEKLAEYFLKIDDAKPFEKGNIATAKVFIKELAAKNGFDLDMGKLTSKVSGFAELSKTIEKSFNNIEPSKDLMKAMDFSVGFER